MTSRELPLVVGMTEGVQACLMTVSRQTVCCRDVRERESLDVAARYWRWGTSSSDSSEDRGV